jgi:4-hydroxybenzoate polyprenyltransferase
LAYMGKLMSLQSIFWVSLGLAAAGWLWQYLRLKKSIIPPTFYPQMFRENVWIGFGLLVGMILGIRN